MDSEEEALNIACKLKCLKAIASKGQIAAFSDKGRSNSVVLPGPQSPK
jgi:hypothetical protein